MRRLTCHRTNIIWFIINKVQLHEEVRYDTVRVKLCGDGAKFSTWSNFFILSFSLLNLEKRVLAPRGKFTINLFTHKPIVNACLMSQ